MTTEKAETQEVKVENLVISTMRNVRGWYTASAFVNGFLMTVRFNRRPTKAAERKALVEFWNNY